MVLGRRGGRHLFALLIPANLESIGLVYGMVQNKQHFNSMRSNEYLRIISHLLLYINKQVEDEDF